MDTQHRTQDARQSPPGRLTRSVGGDARSKTIDSKKRDNSGSYYFEYLDFIRLVNMPEMPLHSFEKYSISVSSRYPILPAIMI